MTNSNNSELILVYSPVKMKTRPNVIIGFAGVSPVLFVTGCTHLELLALIFSGSFGPCETGKNILENLNKIFFYFLMVYQVSCFGFF